MQADKKKKAWKIMNLTDERIVFVGVIWLLTSLRSAFGFYTNLWYLYANYFIMARNTSILLGEYFEDFISSEVSSGKYSSASEVVRTALRLLELEESKKKNLSKALRQGERSGFVKNFDAKANLKKLRAKLQ